jgi:hypothetical protein
MYCEYEGRDFPNTEFTVDPKYGRVHNRPPKHTVAGDLLPKSGRSRRHGPLPGRPRTR